jgi:flagellar hook-length control protein FliK
MSIKIETAGLENVSQLSPQKVAKGETITAQGDFWLLLWAMLFGQNMQAEAPEAQNDFSISEITSAETEPAAHNLATPQEFFGAPGAEQPLFPEELAGNIELGGEDKNWTTKKDALLQVLDNLENLLSESSGVPDEALSEVAEKLKALLDALPGDKGAALRDLLRRLETILSGNIPAREDLTQTPSSPENKDVPYPGRTEEVRKILTFIRKALEPASKGQVNPKGQVNLRTENHAEGKKPLTTSPQQETSTTEKQTPVTGKTAEDAKSQLTYQVGPSDQKNEKALHKEPPENQGIAPEKHFSPEAGPMEEQKEYQISEKSATFEDTGSAPEIRLAPQPEKGKRHVTLEGPQPANHEKTANVEQGRTGDLSFGVHVSQLSQTEEATGISSRVASGGNVSGSLAVHEIPGFVKELVLRPGRAGRHEARIRLEPPELGKLHISLSVDKGEVRLLFTVEHPQAAQALHHHLHDLAKALTEAGLQLGGCEIGFADGQHQGFQGEQSPARKWNSFTGTEPVMVDGEREVPSRRGLIDLRV